MQLHSDYDTMKCNDLFCVLSLLQVVISEGCATHGGSSDGSQEGKNLLSLFVVENISLHLLPVLIQPAPLCISQVKKSTWSLVLLWSWHTRSNWFRQIQGLGPGHVAARRTLLPCGSVWRGWRGRCQLSGRNVEELREAAAPLKRAKVFFF